MKWFNILCCILSCMLIINLIVDGVAIFTEKSDVIVEIGSKVINNVPPIVPIVIIVSLLFSMFGRLENL